MNNFPFAGIFRTCFEFPNPQSRNSCRTFFEFFDHRTTSRFFDLVTLFWIFCLLENFPFLGIFSACIFEFLSGQFTISQTLNPGSQDFCRTFLNFHAQGIAFHFPFPSIFPIDFWLFFANWTIYHSQKFFPHRFWIFMPNMTFSSTFVILARMWITSQRNQKIKLIFSCN